MAEEKDLWLEDLDDEDSSGELEQSNIDSLLADAESPAPAQSNPAGDPSQEESGGDELDQSDIDSLLGGGEASESLGDAGEIDQSDIDSLFSADEGDLALAEADESGEEVNQSDIDALLAGEPVSSDEDVPDISPDQEEIDRLFSETDDEPAEADPFQAEEIDFQDIIDESEDQESFLSTGNEFADEEFDFDDDTLDIPDDGEETTVFASKENLHSSTVSSETVQEALEAENVPLESEAKKTVMPEMSLPAALQGRKKQSIAAAMLAVLLLVTYFIFSGDQEPLQVTEKTPKVQKQEMTSKQPVVVEAPKPPNTPPAVADGQFELGGEGPLVLQLTAQDPDGDELQYEIMTQPEHGLLKGQAPYLIYIPNEDFPGLDMFNFRVTDGRDFSAPALVKITEKPKIEAQTAQISQPEKKEPEIIRPRKLMISAHDFSYDVVGTKDFIIDWEKIWNEANYLPYTNQIAVEILSSNLQGKLSKISEAQYLYRAKKYFSGHDKIQYRFKLGNRFSKAREITLNIDPGDPAPEIVLQPLADFYKPGEQVFLDVTASMDEDRGDLHFVWRQIAGVPVQLGFLNKEGSRVSFIAPSSFSTVKNPGPMLRVTAIDQSGQKDTKDIKVPTKSRRTSALWGIAVSGGF
jgi:hypothetical protein